MSMTQRNRNERVANSRDWEFRVFWEPYEERPHDPDDRMRYWAQLAHLPSKFRIGAFVRLYDLQEVQVEQPLQQQGFALNYDQGALLLSQLFRAWYDADPAAADGWSVQGTLQTVAISPFDQGSPPLTEALREQLNSIDTP